MAMDIQAILEQIKHLNQEKDTLVQQIRAIDRRIHELSAELCPAGQCLLPNER